MAERMLKFVTVARSTPEKRAAEAPVARRSLH